MLPNHFTRRTHGYILETFENMECIKTEFIATDEYEDYEDAHGIPINWNNEDTPPITDFIIKPKEEIV